MKITYKGKPINCSYSNKGSQDTLKKKKVIVSLKLYTEKNYPFKYIKKKKKSKKLKKPGNLLSMELREFCLL